MSIHRPHPIQGEWCGKDYDDPEGDGLDRPFLFDDCPRCAEHAESLVSLDRDNRYKLMDIVYGGRPALTKTEERAANRLRMYLRTVESFGIKG